MLRQGDSQLFKKYSQVKLQMKREALQKLNRQANEMTETLCQNSSAVDGFGTVLAQYRSWTESLPQFLGQRHRARYVASHRRNVQPTLELAALRSATKRTPV